PLSSYASSRPARSGPTPSQRVDRRARFLDLLPARPRPLLVAAVAGLVLLRHRLRERTVHLVAPGQPDDLRNRVRAHPAARDDLEPLSCELDELRDGRRPGQ